MKLRKREKLRLSRELRMTNSMKYGWEYVQHLHRLPRPPEPAYVLNIVSGELRKQYETT